MRETPPQGTLTQDDFRRIREVFESAVERSAKDRRAFVEQACGGNTMLVAEVNRMLDADAREDRLLNRDDGARPTACPSCHAALNADDRFCRQCGTPAHGSGSDEGRFRAGALFANRFRIVTRLGRGGMGDVYRADDLEVGQPVALKFLTGHLKVAPTMFDERARTRLRSEVRLARQISHPNVCRVYDIGESQGELYLSMEYVDGEDLAALLTRIGRLPIDKGIEIARKLCAGLAAAHAKGVLHRDFKPANIMIDGHGEVRIMDFGLAAIASELDASDVRSGTPAYMAPEQLAGREATKQSDLYALGLVLYELFTGKPAFETKDLTHPLQLRQAHPSTTPSTLIPDITPRLERAMLKCLEPDPRLRPSSALEVAASLPGGDPLAEALAAGETPSPEIVAAAGTVEGLRRPLAIALFMTVVGGLVAILALTPQSQVVTKLPLDHPPEVLISKAQDILRAFGHAERPVDAAWGFRYDETYIPYIEGRMTTNPRARSAEWDAVLSTSPSPVVFWYQQSSEPLVRDIERSAPGLSLVRGTRVIPAGGSALPIVSAELDLTGRLLRFDDADASAATSVTSTPPDWVTVFALAGLDSTLFTPTDSQTDRRVVSDVAAWMGTYPGKREFPVRVEAETIKGSIARLRVLFPWSRDRTTMYDVGGLSRFRVNLPWLMFVYMVLFGGAAIVARRNWRAGRADAAGAWRLSVAVMLCLLIFLGLSSHDFARTYPVELSTTVFWGVIAGILYLALEPWIRRFWPEMIITWSRVIAGRWRDQSVARDVMYGVAAATVNQVLQHGIEAVAVGLGASPRGPIDVTGLFGFVLANLAGQRLVFAVIAYTLWRATYAVVFFFFLLLILKILLRRTWLAATSLFVLLAGLYAVPGFMAGDWMTGALWLIEGSFLVLVMLRCGLLAAGAFVFVSILIIFSVLTPAFNTWYGQSSLIACAVVTLIAAWSYWTAVRDLAVTPVTARHS
jgi:predicted Ser/Thr protein kinase